MILLLVFGVPQHDGNDDVHDEQELDDPYKQKIHFHILYHHE
jgi:hypothetical protein